MNCIKDGKYTGDSCFGCNVKVEDCEIRDKVYRNRWIPVSEKIPSEDGLYLVTIKNLTGYNKLGKDVIFCRFDYDEWYFDGWEDNKVIAWQSLPESYKDIT